MSNSDLKWIQIQDFLLTAAVKARFQLIYFQSCKKLFQPIVRWAHERESWKNLTIVLSHHSWIPSSSKAATCESIDSRNTPAGRTPSSFHQPYRWWQITCWCSFRWLRCNRKILFFLRLLRIWWHRRRRQRIREWNFDSTVFEIALWLMPRSWRSNENEEWRFLIDWRVEIQPDACLQALRSCF